MKQIPNKLIKLEYNQFRRQDILSNIKFTKIQQLSHFLFLFSSLYMNQEKKIVGNRNNNKNATPQTPILMSTPRINQYELIKFT